MMSFLKSAMPLILSVLLVLSACAPEQAQTTTLLHPIKQDFEHVILTAGQVKPVTVETLNAPQRIWGTLETLLPEGTQVKEGDRVASISTRKFRERISGYYERFEQEQAQLKEKQASLPLEQLKIQAEIEDKERLAAQQEQELNLISAGPRLDERVKARVDKEVATLRVDSFPLKEKEQLYQLGYVSLQELEQDQQELRKYQTERDTAILTLKQQSRVYRGPEIEQAELKNQAAGLETHISELSGQAQQSLLKTQGQNQQTRVNAYQKRYDSFQERINGAEITAPFDGTIFYPKVWGNQSPYIGMEVWGGSAIIQVARTDQLMVSSRVDEFSIPHIQQGQQVKLTSPGFPGKIFTGKIAKIQKLAKYKDETNPVGLKYFDIDIAVDGFAPLEASEAPNETDPKMPGAEAGSRSNGSKPRGSRPKGSKSNRKKKFKGPSAKVKPGAAQTVEATPSPDAAVLKANMHVEVAIQIQSLPAVWTVPLETLVSRKDKNYLRIRKNGAITELEVDVLARSENLAALKGSFTGQEELVLAL